MTPLEIYNLITEQSLSIVTDTRKIVPNSIFITLVGEKFDGNDFAENALEQGASFALVSNPKFAGNEKMIVVDDTLKTLQEIAKIHRETFSVPVLVIGGSNGKTTTKELITAVLGRKYRVHMTAGNLNNHIGVPLTLLAMPRDTQIAIIEIGANHIGEHAELLQIVQPTNVLVTNNGQDHLEGFGSIEGVRTANKEIFDWAKQYGAEIFVNKNIVDLVGDSSGGDVVLYPEKEFIGISKITAGGNYNGVAIKSNLFGSFNEANILASIAVGEYFKVPLSDIANAISEYEPTLKRSQIIERDNYILIMDCYNANPSSMELSLKDVFQSFRDKEKIIIVGDMFELGEQSLHFHQEILQLIQGNVQENDTVICIGNDFSYYQEKFPFQFFKTTAEAKIFFESLDKNGKVTFMKGSRGVKLEEILE